MTALDDAIRKARGILSEPATMIVNPWRDALRDLIAALDAADRLPRGTSFARRLTPGMGGEEWSWQGRGFRGHSTTLIEAIAEALDAAEREAAPVDLMARLRESLGLEADQ